MEIQFDKIPIPYLQMLTGQMRTQEQTLEVRLPDGMPDIGRVLGAWGQVLTRSKEWNNSTMGISCGVMVWVLYIPEEGGSVQSVEAWLPFSMKWDLPETQYDGRIIACCQLKNVDARSTSARKLIVRANLEVMGQAWQQDVAQSTRPVTVPTDVEVLTAEYPVLLAKEAGEKSFLLDEQLNLPSDGPKIEKMMYYRLCPEVIDKKLMAGKIVFRGTASLHILYRGEDQKLYTHNFDLPFSQYGDLEESCEEDAVTWVYPCVTSLDVAVDENGILQVKAGLLGQYLLAERTYITVAEDAYSTRRPITLTKKPMQLPVILDNATHNISAEKTVQVDAGQIVDIAVSMRQCPAEETENGMSVPVNSTFQVLYYDQEGNLGCTNGCWESAWELPAAKGCAVSCDVWTIGKPQATTGAGNINLRADMCVEARTSVLQEIPLICDIELGEIVKPDANRPGLILRRAGSARLWDIAKETRTTVEAIKSANNLHSEPATEQILLIPLQ